MNRLFSFISESSSAIIFIGCLSLVFSAFFLPIPSYLLDVLIASNVIISLAIVLNALSASNLRQFVIFPTLIFFITIFRLALNLSSTRLILLEGDEGVGVAGEVIESFGQFVVGGDFVVGAVIFMIISIVNFFVVTKGSTRVAEVAARFTLDSLPGEQMSIESELRSGNISKEEAGEKRQKLSLESKFYGSMDGAMKFVQGDAIAGLIIICLNFIVGSALGVSRGMDVSEAISAFGILTVGDGLVSILPAFLVSISAGLVVTRINSSSEDSSHFAQIKDFAYESIGTIVIASSLLILLGIFSDFPFWPFAIFLFFFISIAYLKFKNHNKSLQDLDVSPSRNVLNLDNSPINYLTLFNESVIDNHSLVNVKYVEDMHIPPKIQIKINEQSFISKNSFLEFISRIKTAYSKYKKSFWEELGFKVPDITISLDKSLSKGEYLILVGNTKIERSKILDDYSLVLVDERFLNLMRIDYQGFYFDEIIGTSGFWVLSEHNSISLLEKLGIPIIDFYEYLALKICFTSLCHLEKVYGLQDVKEKYSLLNKDYPDLYKEVFAESGLSFTEITELTRNMINQGINVSDVRSILESSAQYIAYHNPISDDMDSRNKWLQGLSHKLRSNFLQSLIEKVSYENSDLHVFSLSESVEEVFEEVAEDWKTGLKVIIDFKFDSILKRSVKETFSSVKSNGRLPVLLVCSKSIREVVEVYFRETFNSKSWLYVMSFDELPSSANIKIISSF